MPARPRGLDELRSEPLDPPVDGHMVDGDTTLGQQLLNIPVRQAIPQVPADRHRYHLPRKPEAANTADEPGTGIAPVSPPPRSANPTPPLSLLNVRVGRFNRARQPRVSLVLERERLRR